ncbi:MAG TPA: class I SAM-dependent methyltransferase [Aeromicrobium sp.]|nr:class I SAM-dependent methyltransferase [Aeromicrobium sp.]
MAARWRQYRRIGHRTVPGWLQAQTLDVLAVLRDVQVDLGVSGSVAEIGVYAGKLFIGLQALTPPGTPALAVDSFVDQSANLDEAGGTLSTFEAHVRRWGDWSTVTVEVVDSSTLTADRVATLANEPVRFFSVDGAHTAEATVWDIANAEAALAKGGVLIVDDIFNEQWPGVMDGAMAHLDRGSSLIPFAIGFNKTYFTNSAEHAERYERALREAFSNSLTIYRKTTRFHGHDVELVMRSALTPRNVLRRFPQARRLYFALRRKAGR